MTAVPKKKRTMAKMAMLHEEFENMVTSEKKIRVVLVGCSGYAGLEVMRCV